MWTKENELRLRISQAELKQCLAVRDLYHARILWEATKDLICLKKLRS